MGKVAASTRTSSSRSRPPRQPDGGDHRLEDVDAGGVADHDLARAPRRPAARSGRRSARAPSTSRSRARTRMRSRPTPGLDDLGQPVGHPGGAARPASCRPGRRCRPARTAVDAADRRVEPAASGRPVGTAASSPGHCPRRVLGYGSRAVAGRVGRTARSGAALGGRRQTWLRAVHSSGKTFLAARFSSQATPGRAAGAGLGAHRPAGGDQVVVAPAPHQLGDLGQRLAEPQQVRTRPAPGSA